jgi:hypothetical protein
MDFQVYLWLVMRFLRVVPIPPQYVTFKHGHCTLPPDIESWGFGEALNELLWASNESLLCMESKHQTLENCNFKLSTRVLGWSLPKGIFARKVIRLLRILLNSHWLRVTYPTLGLHKGNFGPHPIKSSMDEKSTWISHGQCWLGL